MNRNIAVIIRAELAGFGAQLATAGAQVRQFGHEADTVATRTDASSRRALDTIAKLALALSVGLFAALGGSVVAATQFDRAMHNVASITDRGSQSQAQFEAQMRRTGAAVLDMSRDFPQSAKVLAEGLYEVTSSGFGGAEALNVLKVSALSASAGLTTTDTSAKAIAASLNAYGKSGFEAAQVSDILFATVKLGVVTFEELAQSMGDWVGTAAAAKVPLQDASAAYAAMTLNGISASEAGTSVNNMLRSLLKPTDELTKLVRAHGFETVQDALAQRGLHGVMQMVRDATGGNAAALMALFPEIRAARGAYALLAGDMGAYNRIQGEMTDLTKLAGEAQEAYNEQSKSFAFQLDLAKNNVMALGIEVGQVMLPWLSKLLGLGTGVIDMFHDLPGPARAVVVVFALLTAGALAVGGGFLLLAPRIAAVRTLMAGLHTSAPGVASGLSMVGKAAGVLSVAMTVGTLVMSQYGAEKRRVKGYTDEFTQAILAEKAGQEGATTAAAIRILTENGMLKMFKDRKVAVEDVVNAALGDERALQAVRKAASEAGVAFFVVEGTLGEVAQGHRDGAIAANLQEEATRKLKPPVEDLSKAWESAKKAGDDWAASFLGSFDLIGGYGASVEASAAAVDRATKAEESLEEAIRSAGEAAEDGARRVEEAGQRVEDAIANEAEVAEKSAERIAAARDRLAEAMESGAERTAAAEDKLTTAQERERQAQEELTDARREARQELEDLADSVERSQISEERARFRLDDARKREQELIAKGEASERDLAEARLDVRDAELTLKDATEKRAEQEQRLQKLQNEGIESSKQVVEANERLAAAHAATAVAQADLTKAQRDGARDIAAAQKSLHEAQVQGAKDVAAAQADTAKAQAEASRAAQDLARQQEDGARRVAAAQAELGKAMRAVGETDLSGFFDRQTRLAQEFVDGVADAAQRGLDPALIQKLLEAGPEKAKPILDAIAADHSGGLIEMANKTQAKLNQISKSTIELARATHIAITTTSQQVANDWGRAMDIMAAKAKLGARGTAQNIARELDIGEGEVRRIANEYLIDIDTATADAARAGTENAEELRRNLVAKIEDGTVSADQQMAWWADATGVNMEEARLHGATDMEGLRRDLIAKIVDGTVTTDRQMAWWADATGANLGRVAGAIAPTLGAPSGARESVIAGNQAQGLTGYGLAEGGFLPGDATFMRPRGRKGIVQWAEDETEGEWFLPHAMAKRGRSLALAEKMLRLWGYSLQPAVQSYAYGGTHGGVDEFGFDRPPAYGPGVLTSDAADTFTGQVYEMVRQFMAAGGSGSGTGPGAQGPAAPAQVREWVRQGVELAAKPAGWVDPESRIAMFESGGDPGAINLWDWNAEQGHPSKGLMQCVPLDSEILTREGWKRHDEVRIGDETLGFNPATSRNEWTPVTKIVHYEGAPVVRIGNKNWSARVTPNHRWWSEPTSHTVEERDTRCPQCGSEWPTPKGMETHLGRVHGRRLPRRKSVGGRFVRTDAFKTNDRLRLAAPATTDGIPCLSLVDVRVLAWLQGDGHLRPAKEGGFDGWIYQSKPTMVVKLRELLVDVPHTERSRQRNPNHLESFVFTLRRGYVTDLVKRSEILDVGPEAFVLALSPQQRAAWLSAMIDAEGHRQTGNGQTHEFVRIAQKDGPLQDAITLAVYLEGFRPSFSRFNRIEPHHAPAGLVGMCGAHVVPVMFDAPEELPLETVWCVKTDLETWTMRQDGQVMLTGNTIDSTFQAHKVPGHDDIWNPVDNVAAASNYIAGRYGTPWNTPGERSIAQGGAYQGYGVGGFRWNGVQLLDRGGWLRPGVTGVLNNTGGMEYVPDPTGRMLAAGGGVDQSITVSAGAIQVEVHVAAGVERGAVQREVHEAVRAATAEFVSSLRSSLRAGAGRRS